MLESAKDKERLLTAISLLPDQERVSSINQFLIKINENAEPSDPQTKETKKGNKDVIDIIERNLSHNKSIQVIE